LDLFSSVVSRPAGRLLEGSIRSLVNELIRDHDLASAAEADSLRRMLEQLESRVADLEARLADTEARGLELESALEKTGKELADAQGALSGTQAALEDLRARCGKPEEQAQAAAEPEPAPAKRAAPSARKPKGCKVPGCENKHRSKGFCSPHYQRWRRGTLEGF